MSERPKAPAVLGLALVVIIGFSGGSIMFADVGSAQSVVLIEDDITEDTTWGTGTGPYRVVKSIHVTEGTRLTIQPGVTVEIAEGVSITVDGSISAIGEEANPITFTSSQSSPQPGDWDTLTLSAPGHSVSRIQHAEIDYATNGLTVEGAQETLLTDVEITNSSNAGIFGTGATKTIPTADVTLRNSKIHGNKYGIRGKNGAYHIIDSRISNNNRAGIALENKLNVIGLDVEDSAIIRNGNGISVVSEVTNRGQGGRVSRIHLSDTILSKNGGLGVQIEGYQIRDVQFSNITVQSNGATGLLVQDRGSTGESKATGNIHIEDTSLSDNGDRGVRIGASYSSLEDISVRQTTVSENTGTGIEFEADKIARNVTLRTLSVRNNGGTGISVVGSQEVDSVDVSDSVSSWNKANGIGISGGGVSGVSVVENTISRSGSTGVYVSGAPGTPRTTIQNNLLAGNQKGMQINNHAANISENTVEFNTDVGIQFSGAKSQENLIWKNDIYGNGHGLIVPDGVDSLVATATNNYWGASSGPQHSSVNPEGEGNEINGALATLEFIPFAESPFYETNDRPTPEIQASSTTIENGSTVTFSGADSTDDGAVEWYNFHYNNSETSGWQTSSEVTRVYAQPGNYTVGLTVIDDRGVDSNETARVTIRVVKPTPMNTTTNESSDSNNGGNGGSGNGNDTPTTEPNGENETFVPGLGFPVAIAALLVAFVLYGRFGDR